MVAYGNVNAKHAYMVEIAVKDSGCDANILHDDIKVYANNRDQAARIALKVPGVVEARSVNMVG